MAQKKLNASREDVLFGVTGDEAIDSTALTGVARPLRSKLIQMCRFLPLVLFFAGVLIGPTSRGLQTPDAAAQGLGITGNAFIHGRVVRILTNAPVAGATINIQSVGSTGLVTAKATTDVNGNFQATLLGVLAGTQTLSFQVNATGFFPVTFSFPVTVTAGATLDVLTNNIVMAPTSTTGLATGTVIIRGRVFNIATGVPIPGATVTVQSVGATGSVFANAITDQHGNFVITLTGVLIGTQQLSFKINSDGFVDFFFTFTVVVLQNQTVEVRVNDVFLTAKEPSGSVVVSGRVFNVQTNQPVVGARVAFTGTVVSQVFTDIDGKYEIIFPLVLSGQLTVVATVRQPGFEGRSVSRSQKINAFELVIIRDLDIGLTPLQFPGSMRAGTGHGLSGAIARVPVVLYLTPTVQLDALSFGFRIVPNGTAPPITAVIGYRDLVGLAPPLIANPDINEVSVLYSGLAPSLARRVVVGEIILRVPSNAVPSQTYSLQVFDPQGSFTRNTIQLIPQEPNTFTVSLCEYLVGDGSPFLHDRNGDGDLFDCGEFGDSFLDIQDVIATLFAITSAQFIPPKKSDYFDALDSFTLDRAEGRGGDRILDIQDVLTTLGRATGTNPTLPTRITNEKVVRKGSGRVALHFGPSAFGAGVGKQEDCSCGSSDGDTPESPASDALRGTARANAKKPNTPPADNGGDTPPQMSFVPDNLKLGPVSVGSTRSRLFAVQNTGTTAVTISSITASSADLAVEGVPSMPYQLAAGATLTMIASYSPSSADAFAGAINVLSDDPISPRVAMGVEARPSSESLGGHARIVSQNAVPGQTVGMPITFQLDQGVSVKTIAFGFSVKGESSAPVLPAAIQFQSTIPGVTPLIERVNNNSISVLMSGIEPGLSGNVTVGTLLVNVPGSAVIGHQYRVALTAPQAAASQALWLDPTERSTINVGGEDSGFGASASVIDFGHIGPGTTSTRSLEVFNSSALAGQITGIDAPQPPFSIPQSGTGPLVIPAGASETFSLQFNPSTTGTFTSLLRVRTSDPDHPTLDVFLVGTAELVTPASVTLSPSVASLGKTLTTIVRGNNIQTGAVLMLNGDPSALVVITTQPAKGNGSPSLMATIPATFFTRIGTVQAQVLNPDGGVSAPVTITVSSK